MMDLLPLILTILAGILCLSYVFYKRSSKLDKWGILHPKSFPLIGDVASMFFKLCHITVTLDKIYHLNEDADYVGFYAFHEPIIMIRSPELIKSLAIKNFDHFVDHRAFVNPDIDPFFGKNIFGLQGDKWREIRGLLSPAFTSSKMRTMFKLMSNCGKNFVDYLAERSIDRANVIDAKDAFTRYTNDVIATCAFGISIDSMRNPNNDFYVLGKDATNVDGFRVLKGFITRRFPTISRLLSIKLTSPKVESFFTNIVKDTIEMRDKEGINRPDMIQLMMDSRVKKSDEGPELTLQDMTAQAFIFFFGGFESTATAMCFVAHEIAANPEVQHKLRHEVDRMFNETNGDVTYEAINGMQYLDAVINETLRLYPINVSLDRVCVKTFELPPAFPGANSVTIEPGQNIWFPAYCIQRDSKYFPNPEKFDPERFMGSAKNNIDPSTYFPFGQGPRMCIGNRFALLEIKVMVCHLLANCHLKPCEKTRLPIEFDKASFNMVPKGGFWLQLEKRNTFVIQ